MGVSPAPADGRSGHCKLNASNNSTPHTNTGMEMPSSAPMLAR